MLSVPLEKYTIPCPLPHCRSTLFHVPCPIAEVHCYMSSVPLHKYVVPCPLTHCISTPLYVHWLIADVLGSLSSSHRRNTLFTGMRPTLGVPSTLFNVLSLRCTLFAVLCPSLDYPVPCLLSHCRLHCSLSFVSLQKYTVPCPLSYWRSILFYVLFQNS